MFNSVNSPPINSSTDRDPVNKFVHAVLSHDSNIMLAAIISLLVVILFVLLLHIYAKWFLFRARQRSSTRTSVLVPLPQVLGVSSLPHFHSFAAVHSTSFASSPTKGLEAAAISLIPIFVYRTDDDDDDEHELIECAICLSVFEDEEVGRRLPRCRHAFHVDCIDMWFDSHSTCPICRSCPLLLIDDDDDDDCNYDIVIKVVDGETTETVPALLPETEIMTNDHGETSRLTEIITVEAPNAENGIGVSTTGTAQQIIMCASPSSSSSPAVPVSVKRMMMSRNRSERKVHPSILTL